MLILTSRGELIFEEENCLDVSKSYAGAPVEILKCHGMGGNQKWEHDKKSVSLHMPAFFLLLSCGGTLASCRELSRGQTFAIFWHSLTSFLLKKKETRMQ